MADERELARALALSLEGLMASSSSYREEANVGGVNTRSSDNRWYPNMECVQVLLSMGISENAASRGLYHTGNTSPDLAAAWVFDHLEDPNLHDPFQPPPLSVDPPPPTLPTESRSLKMVFVVNTSIGMGIGKIASQVAHATLALYKTLLLSPSEQRVVEEWEMGGAKKIVLKGRDVDHLKELEEEAKKRNIPHFMISDAGKTQIEPGSLTVLALFGRNYLVDEVTGNLSLL
ncbi:PREDICTED: peptidyl-tRNA hydrolase 2, mitochondrial-like isoform X2 [Amphimedon queenslandica]|uniref:peptidyl-tRNA hydrolase n=1 Tax=Amphimedon queenslandica TaxID=400682 RepID=A0A1X7UH70_AMPQE|nr:PREDICTED: peptidyl-tRNA hydrolase 2, mitochondrial-like isoform X2 [Amphimedon queenslandica]|eukprot:XP_003387939.1 PREDICTED: peptidyl-tRNA hydrolase 2, mitochondrial-like isoform X2 [Amphimedon queenslandica]